MNNYIYAVGNLTEDPILQYTSEGKAWLRFNIAVSQGKDKNRNDLPTMFFSGVCFGSYAENTAESIVKGDRISVYGVLEKWESTKDGKTISGYRIRAQRVGIDMNFNSAKANRKQRKEKYEADIPEESVLFDKA